MLPVGSIPPGFTMPDQKLDLDVAALKLARSGDFVHALTVAEVLGVTPWVLRVVGWMAQWRADAPDMEFGDFVVAYRESLQEKGRPQAAPEGAKTFSWSEESHPRDDSGRFVSSADIRNATRNPASAKALRASVTEPGERKKLDALIGTQKPLGGVERARAADAVHPADSPHALGPQYHDWEGAEHVRVLRGDYIAKIKAAGEGRNEKAARAAVGEVTGKAIKAAAVHWREAQKKAVAQFKADYPPGSGSMFGNEEDDITAAFQKGEAAVRSAYEEMGEKADNYARLLATATPHQRESQERELRKEFEAACDAAEGVYGKQFDDVRKVVERTRDDLGGKEKGHKLNRYFM